MSVDKLIVVSVYPLLCVCFCVCIIDKLHANIDALLSTSSGARACTRLPSMQPWWRCWMRLLDVLCVFGCGCTPAISARLRCWRRRRRSDANAITHNTPMTMQASDAVPNGGCRVWTTAHIVTAIPAEVLFGIDCATPPKPPHLLTHRLTRAVFRARVRIVRLTPGQRDDDEAQSGRYRFCCARVWCWWVRTDIGHSAGGEGELGRHLN